MLFVIRNGQLVPTNLEFKDFYDVHNALGHVDAGEPSLPGEVVVVVADARQPLRRVPKDALTVTTVSDPDEDVYLFWAVNEDDGDEEVIVAFDNFDVANNYDDLWRIIGFDEWTQLPLNKELICALRSVDEARAFFRDGMVFVPFELGDGGWCGVVVHGHNRPWDIDDIRNAEHPFLIEMGLIPTGWHVHNLIVWKQLPELRDVLTEDEANKLHEAYKTAALVRVVGTATGGAAPIFRLKDGENGGIVLLYKIFTHEEARTSLRL